MHFVGAIVAPRALVRSIKLVIAAFVVALAAPTVAHAQAFIPPMKVDVGWATTLSEGVVTTGRQTFLGLSWATVVPRPTWFDIGVGYVTAEIPVDQLATRGTHTMSTDSPHLHGGYLELGARIVERRGWRTWAMSRFEVGGAEIGRASCRERVYHPV